MTDHTQRTEVRGTLTSDEIAELNKVFGNPRTLTLTNYAADTALRLNAALVDIQAELSIVIAQRDSTEKAFAKMREDLVAVTKDRDEARAENKRNHDKWWGYEQEHVLPVFKWAEECGIDLPALVLEAKGNCTARFFEALKARAEAAEKERDASYQAMRGACYRGETPHCVICSAWINDNHDSKCPGKVLNK